MSEQPMEFQTEYQAEPQKKNETKKRCGPWLLIILLVVLVLFLASTALLGFQLFRIATRDKFTVNLEVSNPTGQMELFRVEYANADGEITVKGTNGETVIAPGTDINYDLRLRNHDDCIIDFMMIPSVEFFTDEEVPVEFKVRDNYGNYVLGSENTWVSAKELSALVHKGTVHPTEVYTYYISWQWAFDVSQEQDAADTKLGGYDGENPPGLSVKIETHASANPTPVKSNAHMSHLLGEGFGCCWCCWLVWLLLLICVLLLIWVWRLRRKLRKREEELEEYKNAELPDVE